MTTNVNTSMKERPILFSKPMVQAILVGRKTMTRRVIKPQPDSRGLRTTDVLFEDYHGKEFKCPYELGMILWVRETFRNAHGMPTGPRYEYKATALKDGVPIDEPWKPSIFMPREACRIMLEITNIRVERLQDISEEDAINEGVEIAAYRPDIIYKQYTLDDNKRKIKLSGWETAYYSFKSLWQSINGPESWTANPWVWVIEFKRIDR